MTDQTDQTGPLAEDSLAAATARADHFERLFAAVVARVGPFILTGLDYDMARPADLTVVAAVDDPANRGPDSPIIYGYPDQLAKLGFNADPQQPAAGS